MAPVLGLLHEPLLLRRPVTVDVISHGEPKRRDHPSAPSRSAARIEPSGPGGKRDGSGRLLHQVRRHQGRERDAKHKDEIDVESWSWGETHATGGPSGGGGAGKVAMQDFHFVMGLNRASIGLMKACATGQHIKTATLSARKAGKGQQEYLTFKFPRRPRQLVPDQRIRGSVRPDRLRVVQLRQDRGRVQAAEGRRLPGVARRVQVRPEDEQDLLARLGRAPAVSQSAPSPSRAPRRAQKTRRRRSSSPGCYASPATSRPNPGAARNRGPAARSPSCRPTCDGSATRMSWPCCSDCSCSVFPSNARLDELVGAPLQAHLAGAGLLVHDTDAVTGRRDSSLDDELLIASDHAGAPEGTRRPCPGCASPVRRPRPPDRSRPRRRALDLCTGNGIQAILLAAHDTVVATDVNERALAYAAFNASERRRQRRDATRQLLRAGRRRAVRPRRRQPAVRRLAQARICSETADAR